MGYSFDYVKAENYYTPSAKELEIERKERQERALLNWSNLIARCSEARKFGITVSMIEVVKEENSFVKYYKLTKDESRNHFLATFQEWISNAIYDKEKAIEAERRKNAFEFKGVVCGHRYYDGYGIYAYEEEDTTKVKY